MHILDSVRITLKNMYSHNVKNYLVIALTEKATSNVSGSTLYLNKEGLSLPNRGKFKELLRERLSYL